MPRPKAAQVPRCQTADEGDPIARPGDQGGDGVGVLRLDSRQRSGRPYTDEIARAEDIGKSWSELSATRQRTFFAALIERIDVEANRIDIHLRPTRLSTLLDIAGTPLSSATDEAQILSVPIKLRRAGREITMLIDEADPFATAKPDARLIKLMIRARRFNATLFDSNGVPFAALAKREGVSPSYCTRLVRLSHLAPDITQAILDGRQPRDLTADKLLARSRLPLTWHEQRTVLGFA